MMVTMIPLVVCALRTLLKGLEIRFGAIRNQRTNLLYYSDHSIV